MRTKNLLLSLLFLFSLVVTSHASINEIQAAKQVGQGSFNPYTTGNQTIVIASETNNTSFFLPIAKSINVEKSGSSYIIYIVVDTQAYINFVGFAEGEFRLYLNSDDYYLIVTNLL